MEKFKVYEDGNPAFFVDTDNYNFAVELAREQAARYNKTVIIERTEDKQAEAVFIGKIEIYRNARGFSICKKGRYNRTEYLKSIYNGKPVFISDYTHQKHYTTLKAARNTAERINSAL